MAFANADEVEKYLGGIFQDAFADPELGPKLRATGAKLQTTYSDPEVSLIVDLGNATVSRADGASVDAAEMKMSADTGNAYWQGKVNLPLAMAKGKVKVSGDITSLLKLAPLTKRLIPAYVDRLKADGREDLLV
ncbi:sterol carrier protein [Gordonia sp. 852002-50816_SCH5313054-c]|uniref:SCP2 sterol-binding domain-containing protein n=1 Tax=Gordonia TaxID=2053 RepID=UPI0007EC1039|nr:MULTISPECIES: SCP2 sterol-binding domain-containing protein [unclassified Gordonia (in: high G+C Gram-positive bacteria)]OBC05147.1 sterol carrier protein [Gordonia sp. 852002-50816_SCH5313054-a]OBC13148.1 sterol carrier protein [Gordonia sp. 852002-50816_SCH5313054-c]